VTTKPEMELLEFSNFGTSKAMDLLILTALKELPENLVKQ
jgi:hypothetical protein